MRLTDEILFFLSQNPGNYKLLRRRLGDAYFEEKLEEEAEQRRAERKRDNKRDRVFRVTLSKLKSRGLIKSENEIWKITTEGLRKIAGQKLFPKLNLQKPKKTKQQVIIAFDIPEDKRKSRYWLRVELVSLGFKMLQKSVWLGPAPLPRELIEHLKLMDLLPHIKFFEVKKSDIV